MAVKKPGFSNAVGSRNRRVNRYAAAGDNREDRRHKEARGTTIGYDTVPTPDEITDSGNNLAQFAVDEVVESEGSTSNDGVDVVQTVAAGALGVDSNGFVVNNQQQQLAIGRALASGPRLLILDEPTEGIQPNIVHEIGDIIIQLNREESLTVLLVEQKLPFARRVATGFDLMERGRVVASGDIAELSEDLIQRHLAV